MDGASSVQSLGNLFTTTTTNALDRSNDIIITPEKAVSYAIIGTGGFLGLGSMMSPYPLFLSSNTPNRRH